MLLLHLNRKPYIGSLMTLSHLTLSDLARLKARPLMFRLISHKDAELGHMLLLLNINKKPYMGNPMAISHLTLGEIKTSKSSSFIC